MNREAYETNGKGEIVPVEDDVFLAKVTELRKKSNLTAAEVEGLTAHLKEAKTRHDGQTNGILRLIDRHSDGTPVYLLKNGTLTTDVPDKQLSFPAGTRSAGPVTINDVLAAIFDGHKDARDAAKKHGLKVVKTGDGKYKLAEKAKRKSRAKPAAKKTKKKAAKKGAPKK